MLVNRGKRHAYWVLFQCSQRHQSICGGFHPVPSRPGILVALLQVMRHGIRQQTHLTLFHAISAAECDQIEIHQR
jgi:hypothetical protein